MNEYVVTFKDKNLQTMQVNKNTPKEALLWYLRNGGFIYDSIERCSKENANCYVFRSGGSCNCYKVSLQVIEYGGLYYKKRYKWEELEKLFPDLCVILSDVVMHYSSIVSGVLQGVCTLQEHNNVASYCRRNDMNCVVVYTGEFMVM